ncbi:AbrB/MazE/SpoVT family DNA-binding domain-containing protein [Ferrovibrio sp.]|uniref:antitoxin n=1 Tax=Ferrovibrio sp. TaxID=1917215 RepID=UPI0025C6CE2D|nr:AbrB/MazE/SpoVT family DNA-binding domain-containing protein [Ferrovibrio sp.]
MGYRTAKLFTTGRSQAVRLPMEFRFEGSEVFVRRDPKTGDVILSSKPASWDGLFALYGKGDVPGDFMGPADRDPSPHNRDPFKGWPFKDGKE